MARIRPPGLLPAGAGSVETGGGLDFGMVGTSSPKGQVSTKSGQLHFGYHLVTAYRFPEVNGRLDRKDAEVYRDNMRALTLSYGDATDLYRANLGWTHQDVSQPRGFNLDLERGYWSRNQADAEDRDDAAAEGRIAQVVPFVRDTRNALVMRFEPPRAAPEMASLQAAFKQAIQQHFRLEPRELSCEAMPSPHDWLAVFRRHADVFGVPSE